MSFLERLAQKSEERQDVRKRFERWLEANPDIRKEVNRLNDEAILREQKAGIAATAAMSMLLAPNPSYLLAAVGFMAESGRQWHNGLKALKERNEIIKKNSPHRQSGTGESS